MMTFGVVILVVVVMAGVEVEGLRLDVENELLTPSYLNEEVINAVVHKMGGMFRKEREHLNSRLAQLQATWETKLETERAVVLENVETIKDLLEEEIGTVRAKVESMADVLGSNTQQLTRVATYNQLVEAKAKISTLVSSSSSKILAIMADVATEAGLVVKVEEVVAAQMQELRQEVGQVKQECGSCGQADILGQVLATIAVTQDDITLLSHQLDNTTSSCTQGCDNVAEVVRSVGSDEDAASTLLAEAVALMGVALEDVQLSLDHILNFTRPPPIPPTTPTPHQDDSAGEQQQIEMEVETPCEDSTFHGRRSEDMCRAAVKFQMCHLTLISYHCCLTCTTLSLIPETGPWRYLKISRHVNNVKAMQLL